MCDEWMRPLQLPISLDQFRQLPRNPAYKYEYLEGQAWLSPRPRFFHGLLDLSVLEGRSLDWIDPATVVRPLEPGDWLGLVDLFAAAFRQKEPFGRLDEKEMAEAGRQCLERTRGGGDGPVIESACLLAYRPEGQRAVGAILITLLPGGDPLDWDSYLWNEPAPPDWLARRLGRPHLTWVFVHPFLTSRGVGTALLDAAGRALLQLGYRELASTFLLGNDSTMLGTGAMAFACSLIPAAVGRRSTWARKNPASEADSLAGFGPAANNSVVVSTQQENGCMAFTTVASVQEIPPGQAKQITVGDRTLALFNVNGTFHALDDTCPHVGGPLSEGTVANNEVECPWHGARFSLTTGGHLCPPARSGVKCYPVKIVGDQVQVDL